MVPPFWNKKSVKSSNPFFCPKIGHLPAHRKSGICPPTEKFRALRAEEHEKGQKLRSLSHIRADLGISQGFRDFKSLKNP
jgi:hypothetical protein